MGSFGFSGLVFWHHAYTDPSLNSKGFQWVALVFLLLTGGPHQRDGGLPLSSSSLQVDPTKGTVGFGSGLHGWAFTLKQFAEIYADKFKIETAKLMKRLWGDQFYSAKEKKWNKTGGEGYVRGFCQFVLDPIFKVSTQACQYLYNLSVCNICG